MEESLNQLFEEEFKSFHENTNKDYLVLSEVLKMKFLENNDYSFNFFHLPTLYLLNQNKDGKFTLSDFYNFSKIYSQKEKSYKRYEVQSQLQAKFTLLMWKSVCSEEGEKSFTEWILKMLLESQNFSLDNEDNPDVTKYIDRSTLRLLYEVLNVKLTHGIDFQSFFDLMQVASNNLLGIYIFKKGLTEENSLDDYLHVNVLNIFCKNFIRGFSKLIIDLGFDSFLLDEI